MNKMNLLIIDKYCILASLTLFLMGMIKPYVDH